MANKIVLISDDSDFFDFVKHKLEMRKSDELFTYKFSDIPDKINSLSSAVLIINSEGAQQQTLDLLNISQNIPSIVMSYNDDVPFKKKCYRAGMLDFIPLLTPDSEFRARILPALNISALLEKNQHYRQILVKNNVIAQNNEVYKDYEKIIDNALEKLKNTQRNCIFMAIAPSDTNKFLLKSNLIETLILNNIRKSDILMSYAPNKYYLLMYDTNIESVQKLWDKISSGFKYKVFAGIVEVKNQKRNQLIGEALNKLNDCINNKPIDYKTSLELRNKDAGFSNFKKFRKEFSQKMEQMSAPVFYATQQKYSNKLSGVNIQLQYDDGCNKFIISNKHYSGEFKISAPGFSKILIDIALKKSSEVIDSKRISFDAEEFETGLLEDLLEQFVIEFKNYIK